MLARLLLGFLADFVLDCSVRAGRTFQTEFHRYLADRGLDGQSRPQRSPAN
jgi:hypothetical protein